MIQDELYLSFHIRITENCVHFLFCLIISPLTVVCIVLNNNFLHTIDLILILHIPEMGVQNQALDVWNSAHPEQRQKTTPIIKSSSLTLT